MKNKWSISVILMLIVISVFLLLFGFNDKRLDNPIEVYQVYLDGEIIGTVSSKEQFESYVSNRQEELKEKFGVDTIYTPEGVDIKKIVTYYNVVDSDEKIYNLLDKSGSFTVKGIVVTVKNSEDEELKINVLNKELFDEALLKTIKAFVGDTAYEKYINNTQNPIVDVGSLIENISLEETVTYKDDLISTSEEIFLDADLLARYLMYGTTNLQNTYVVKEGDTISDVANANKLSVQEFLIANPSFTSENNLLYPSQEVVVDLVNPLVTVVMDEHVVELQEKKFDTEIQYDNNKTIGYTETVREGENGTLEVTLKVRYINGQVSQAVTDKSSEIKPAINKIVIKGDKYIPDVADLSYWAWPTKQPYMITTGYEYRWGAFHPALDITGPGYGSDIYAANNGVVVATGNNPSDRGIWVVINHNNGNYYTLYQHLLSFNVVVGQTVSRGQKIGAMGNTGYCVPAPTPQNPYLGTHLHFEVYIGEPFHGGYTINPWSIY